MAVRINANDTDRKTYRYLRLGIACLPVFLGAALVVDWVGQGNGGCFDSISAYYYTPVRNVFVGTLVAMGLSLIAIQGHFWEDLLLDLAGMFAVVVALVPTPRATPVRCPGQLPEDVEPFVRNGVGAFVAVGALALLVAWLVVGRSKDVDGLKRARVRGVLAASVLYAAFVAWFSALVLGWDEDLFLDNAHFVSAGAMFLMIVLVACVNAFDVPHAQRETLVFEKHTLRKLYFVIAGAMTVVMLAAVVCLVLRRTQGHDPFENWLLYVEILLLVSFSAFWALQTADKWNEEPSGG